MPIARFEMPDGRIGRFEVPDGTTPEQAHTLISQQFGQPQEQPAKEPVSMARTVFDQAQQGQTFGFGDEITDAIGSLGAAAYMKAFRPELMDGNNLEGLYNEARGMSKARLDAEASQSPGTSIAANIAGSLATGAPKAIVSSLRNGGLGTRVLKGGSASSASGAAYGAGTADENERLRGAATGAIIGGSVGAAIPATGAALGAAKRAITPTIEEGMRPVVDLAQKYKIPVALSQVASGNAIKNAQKVSSQLPFSGETAFKEKQMKAFNNALIKTVGGNANKFTPELMDNLFAKVGKEFDDFGKGKTFNLNDDFIAGTSKILDDAEIITKGGAENLNKAIAKIYSNANEAGEISGEKLGSMRAEINRLARKAGKTGNPEAQELLHDLENVIIDTMKAGDDAAGQAFSKTKQKYKNLLVIEPLTNKSKGGNISPTQLQTRVAKIYGRQFTRGNAGEIGDLARIGNELLPELGGSDTTQKMIYAGMGGGALINPLLAIANAGKLATGLGANRAAQTFINRNPAVINAAMKKSRLKSTNTTRITIRPDDDLPEVSLPVVRR